jgi:Tol biopolymer transport system component
VKITPANVEIPSIWIARLLAGSLPVLLLALVFLTPPPAFASAPIAGLATVELIGHNPTSKRSATGNLEVAISSFAENGGSLEHLLTARFVGGGFVPNPFGGISYSPDGSRIAFTAEAEAEVKATRAIYTVNTDGTGLRRIPGTGGGINPVYSPDGITLAFSRLRQHSPKLAPGKVPPLRGHHYSSTTTWLLDIPSGRARRLTPWRNGLTVTPGSFSPDGKTLALTRDDDNRQGPEVVLRPLEGGAPRVLTDLGEEPTFSPDGARVAFVGYRNPTHVEADENQGYAIGEIYSIGTDGMGLRRLTKNKAIETSPAWDPAGSRIAYVEAKPDHSWVPGLANLFPSGNRIREINTDGACARTIRTEPKVALYRVAWSQIGSPDGPLGC